MYLLFLTDIITKMFDDGFLADELRLAEKITIRKREQPCDKEK